MLWWTTFLFINCIVYFVHQSCTGHRFPYVLFLWAARPYIIIPNVSIDTIWIMIRCVCLRLFIFIFCRFTTILLQLKYTWYRVFSIHVVAYIIALAIIRVWPPACNFWLVLGDRWRWCTSSYCYSTMPYPPISRATRLPWRPPWNSSTSSWSLPM